MMVRSNVGCDINAIVRAMLCTLHIAEGLIITILEMKFSPSDSIVSSGLKKKKVLKVPQDLPIEALCTPNETLSRQIGFGMILFPDRSNEVVDLFGHRIVSYLG